LELDFPFIRPPLLPKVVAISVYEKLSNKNRF
jgi:hypothetical protein